MPSSIRPRAALRDAQRWAVETLKRPFSSDPAVRIPGVILAWDMGAGKTGATATAVRDLLDEVVIRKALVVAPKLVAQTTWPDELDFEWEHLQCLSWTLLRVEDEDPNLVSVRAASQERAKNDGMKAADAKRIADAAALDYKYLKLACLAAEPTEIHIINKEGLDWLWENFDQGKRWPYDIIILDDVREAKSGVKRTKGGKANTSSKKASPLSRFGLLAKMRTKCKAVFQLTGTPCPNGLRNLWGLAYLIDGGERLGTARTAFEQRWFTQDRYTYKFKPTESAQREITDRIADIMFALDPAEYPDIPPMVTNKIWIDLPSKIQREYRQFERDLVSQEYDVEAVSAGVLHNKLLQFANGSMYQESGDDVWIHDCKLEALERIVEETQGEPLLVSYSYAFDLARIQKRFKKAVVFNRGDVRENKRRWNAGQIEMMLVHPASAGHGNNIQLGGSILVWYGLTSDLELYQQLNKRLHRPGQTRKVFNHHILAKGTIDADIFPEFLEPKSRTQDEVLQRVMVKLTNRTA